MFDWVKNDLKDFGKYCDTDVDINNLSLERIDLAFIGSGIASTFTLIEFINQIGTSTNKKPEFNVVNPLRIVMFEKDSWLWGGIPYGRRSGFTSLIITPLDEFLPVDECSLFVNWMSENIDWLIVPFKKNAGPRSRKWLKDSEEKIRLGDSSGIHIPRYFFGIYVWEKLKQAVSKSNVDIKLDFVKAEVTSIIENNDDSLSSFEICINDKNIFFTNQILLGVGIPQIRSLTSKNKELPNLTFFNDPYDPDLESTIKDIKQHLENKHLSNILIIGANASALELIYQITNLNNFEDLNVNISVLSPQGKLPDLFIKDKKTDFSADRLQDLSSLSSQITADMILEAFKEDLQLADNNNYDISDTLPIFTNHVGSLVKRLSRQEKFEFTSYHGIEIGRLQRRAGFEYTLPVKELLTSGTLNIIKGRFKDFSYFQDTTMVEFYLENRDSSQKSHYDIVINCAGSSGLTEAGMSPLLRQLRDSGLCNSTPSNHGLVVGDKFDALPGFYINGPLLAGNVIGEMGIWHAEHTGRIIGFAKQIANNIIKDEKFRLNLIERKL